MAKEAKTKAGEESVEEHIAALDHPGLRADAETLAKLFAEISGEPAKMWGASIIGFGSYDYTYDSGHSGSSMRIGFAARKTGLTIYIVPGFSEFAPELEAIGPHTTAKSCLYLKNLQKTDIAALHRLAAKAVAIMNCRYPRC